MNENYDYSSAEAAIKSMELAYNNRDLGGVINSKDFIAEAKLLLEQIEYDSSSTNIGDALISETAKLL